MDEEIERAKALEALSMMRARRNRISMRTAIERVGITRAAMLRWTRPALIQRRGRWEAKPWDRLPRTMRFLDQFGLIEVEIRDSRTATRLAQWWYAVDRLLRTGDASWLKYLRGKSFASRGVRYHFITDPDLLRTLSLVGEVTFEDLYAHVD